MTKQLLGETLIILTGTLFFFVLAATVGIPGNDEHKTTTAVAAEDLVPTKGLPVAPPLEDVPSAFRDIWE